jgi:hypothetical protein
MWIDGWKHIMVVKKCFYKYYFLKPIWLSTSTKSTLKEVFINYIQNKVVQLPNNKIVKRNNIFIDIKWLNNTFVKNKYQYIARCKYIFKMIKVITTSYKILSSILKWIDYIV